MPKTKKMNPQTKPRQNPLKRYWKRSCIILAVIIGLFWFDSVFVGSVPFYAKWIQCGQKPVERQVKLASSASWYHEVGPIRLPAWPATNDFFCTPHDAEMAGISASQYGYEFPHLSPEENIQVRNRIIFGN